MCLLKSPARGLAYHALDEQALRTGPEAARRRRAWEKLVCLLTGRLFRVLCMRL